MEGDVELAAAVLLSAAEAQPAQVKQLHYYTALNLPK